jgi:hypothetical protein
MIVVVVLFVYFLVLYELAQPLVLGLLVLYKNKRYCQIRSSPVCMVINKLPLHPLVFILTPSQRPTLIYIYTTNPNTSLYSIII